ncbi:hypothetical protein KDA_29130 [Dictyobacter alpinus]|uniref:YtkA-like domain-containing protein n=1 Tax=Dictyobacter alpinus TaxID=2014873 RepID=A0A402B7Y4_9CHLR|nr:hypothetical protein [Dictyobacter alpinus]GCE27429.1 hypothetical protein KDA_29130 [Dictyobacter alpinus]
MYKGLRLFALLGMFGFSILLLTTGIAQAADTQNRLQVARTDTVSAGPYIIAVNLSKDPPFVDEQFDITIVPRDASLKLSGKVIMRPGPGTNGINLPTQLTPVGDGKGSLKANVHIPVQGAWDIVTQLNGPKGPGEAKIQVVVGAPGAMPPWLAWLIGASPLVFIAFWIIHQHRYRQSLIKPKTTTA